TGGIPQKLKRQTRQTITLINKQNTIPGSSDNWRR
ncbi:unnamed protein product, partial [Allacma fusca]